MGRILGIDYGSKRVGLAVTDPLRIICSPLDTVHSKDVIAFLKDYLLKEEVDAFVVGMPTRHDNTDTQATPLVRSFINLLKKHFPNTPIYLEDEYNTSKMAMNAMIMGGAKKKDRNKKKGNIDKVSAAIILQSFLENNEL